MDNSQKLKTEQEGIFDMEYINKHINTPFKKLLPPQFVKELDPNFKAFCKGIKRNLREENYEILGVTGYAGCGKSQLAAIFGMMIDDSYKFSKNINFIPTAREIEGDYLKLPMYSYLHVDEASRSLHKHKWFERVQQKLSELYDTERENHYVCSALIMPRFQNFTENFRNFFIKYWINIPTRGIAIFYRRDEDKDTKDPWNVDQSIKLKQKAWKSKRIFERNIPDIVRMEQKTKNYWFYCQIPEIPKPIWSIYKYLKQQSRVRVKENDDIKMESYKEKLQRERRELRYSIKAYLEKGLNKEQIAVKLNMSSASIQRYVREIKAVWDVESTHTHQNDTHNNIYNHNRWIDLNSSTASGNKEQNVKPKDSQWDINGLSKKN